MLTTIGTQGGPDDLGVVFALAVTERASATANQRAALLEALMKATEQRKVRPAGELSSSLAPWAVRESA